MKSFLFYIMLALYLLTGLCRISAAQNNQLPVHYWTSVSQAGNTCGYWATFNGAALYHEQPNFNPDVIRTRAAELARAFIGDTRRMLDSDDIEVLAKIVDVPVLILGLQQGVVVPLNAGIVAQATAKKIDPKKAFEQYYARIHRDLMTAKKTVVIPCVCNSGNAHWVMLALVKRPHEKPFFIAMDSLNGSYLAPIVKPYISFLQGVLGLK